MSERKLKAWEGAGLIDAATADRIRAWEASHARPVGLWAVIGIAALCIGLGLVSLVAANWDAIPGMVRLALHFAVMAGMAVFLWLRERVLAQRQPWLHEAALFVFGMLGLTFMGHVGQVYQTSSPLWQPLALWLVLFAPLLLIRGLSWLTAAMAMVTLIVAAWDYAIGLDGSGGGLGENARVLRMSLATALPVLVAGAVPWLRGDSSRFHFWQRLAQIALIYGVGGTSLIAIASAFEHIPSSGDADQIVTALAVYAAAGLVSAALVFRKLKGRQGQAQAAVLAGGAAVFLLAFPLSGSQFLAGVLFMAFWAGIGAASLHAGWRGTFQLAVGVIALRLIVLSFELASDLLTSGAGLIVSGLLILAVAFAAVRISRHFAPQTAKDLPEEAA